MAKVVLKKPAVSAAGSSEPGDKGFLLRVHSAGDRKTMAWVLSNSELGGVRQTE